MLSKTLIIDCFIFWIWEEFPGIFSWHCRSTEDESTFDSDPYRDTQRLLVDIHLYALKRRIEKNKFPSIVTDFNDDRILKSNSTSKKIFRLPASPEAVENYGYHYWKHKQTVIDHKRELLINPQKELAQELITPSGLAIHIVSRDILYKLPNDQVVLVAQVFEMDDNLIRAVSPL